MDNSLALIARVTAVVNANDAGGRVTGNLEVQVNHKILEFSKLRLFETFADRFVELVFDVKYLQVSEWVLEWIHDDHFIGSRSEKKQCQRTATRAETKTSHHCRNFILLKSATKRIWAVSEYCSEKKLMQWNAQRFVRCNASFFSTSNSITAHKSFFSFILMLASS